MVVGSSPVAVTMKLDCSSDTDSSSETDSSTENSYNSSEENSDNVKIYRW